MQKVRMCIEFIYEQEKSSNNQHRKRLLIRNKTEQNAYLLKAVQDYRQFHAERLCVISCDEGESVLLFMGVLYVGIGLIP